MVLRQCRLPYYGLKHPFCGLSAQPTGIVCHEVETSRQRALGLVLDSFVLAGEYAPERKCPSMLLFADYFFTVQDSPISQSLYDRLKGL